MFRHPLLILAISALTTLLVSGIGDQAEARPVAFEKVFETEKQVGIGVLLGVPLSVSAKYFLNSEWAIDGGAGAYIEYRDRTGFHFHADILWHPFVAVEGETFQAPLYFGLGVRTLLYEVGDTSATHLGARLPVGIAFDLTNQPFDLFLEGALVFDPVVESNAGAVDMNFGAGARYFF